MLGGLAYQSPDHASITNLDLKNISAINAETADTAVDIFVYDTSKDSDGGAWRKRTQHTSWYNEALNTATRGSRREFPAVAVIVAELYKVTIYDGDDPDLPMWMEWTDCNLGGAKAITAIEAKNGIVVWTTDDTTTNGSALYEWNFIAETEYIFGWYNITRKTVGNPFLSRTSERSFVDVTHRGIILNSPLNDVAMTVLPRAPIDPDTGLQIPTIAVATDAGLSVITDSGNVFDDTSSAGVSSAGVEGCAFLDTRVIYYRGGTSGNKAYVQDVSHLSADFTGQRMYRVSPYGETNEVLNICHGLADIDEIESSDDNLILGAEEGIAIINENLESPTKGLIAKIASDYNTGWMHGDIKGAFLADTDDTDLSGTELHPNGNSDFSSTDVSYISNTASGTATVTSGQLVLSGGTANYSDHVITISNLEVGAQYIITVDYVAKSAGAGKIGFYVNGSYLPEVNDGSGYIDRSTGNTYSFYFTTLFSSRTIDLVTGGSTSDTHTFDNWSIKKVEEDRSVNNKGLQVFGTVAKSAVAAGAELVAYGPFSNSSYLYQPYNSDLDLGTGDFSIMVWVKSTNTGYVFWRNDTTGAPLWDVYIENTGSIRIRLDGMQEYVTDGVDTTNWTFVCFTRTSGIVGLYVNAKLGYTEYNASTITNPDAPIYIGRRVGSGAELTEGYVSLMRISGSAPSAEQIKKIYNDEKVLFQENAKCTLYGSSDAITALAYDDSTSLLHVGTSSGRSDFTGLKRINHTTTAVSTAISAQDGLIAQQ